MNNNTTYKFGGMDISGDQYDELRQIAQLGQMGLLDSKSGMNMFAQTLMKKPSALEQAIQQFMGGGDSGIANAYQPAEFMTPSGGVQGQDFYANPTMARKLGYAPESDVLGATSSNTSNQGEPQGSFGFGNAPGQLFGKGGLFHGIVDPLVNATVTGIINPGAAILGTGAGVVRDLGQGKSLEEALTNPYNAPEMQNPLITGKFGMNEVDFGKNFQDYMKNPLVGGLKQGATLLSYAAPAKVPVATQIANPILRGGVTTALQGLTGSTLMGFGQSRAGHELEDTARSAATGTLLGFGLGAGGAALGQVANKVFGKGGAAASNAATTPNVLDQVDEGLSALKQDYIKKGVDPIQIKNFFDSGQANARANYISGNMQGAEQAEAMTQLLKSLSPKDPAYGSVSTMAKTIGLDPSTITKTTKGGVLNRLGEKITQNADDQTMGQFRRELGMPAKEHGLTRLFEDAQKVMVDEKTPMLRFGDNVDDVVAKTQRVLDTQGSIVRNQVDDLATKGVNVDVTSLVDRLKSQMDNAPIMQERVPLQHALETLDFAIKRNGGTNNIPINEFYNLKQSIGGLTKSSPLATVSETQSASAYNTLYGAMNDLFDNTLKSNGFNALKETNKAVSTALRLNNQATMQAAKSVGKAPLTFADLGTGVAGLALSGGNPLGAAAGIAIKKAATSPAAQRMLINAERGVGNVLQNGISLGGGNVGSAVGNVVNSPAAQLVAQIAGGAIPLGVAANRTTLPGMEQLPGESDVLGSYTQSTPATRIGMNNKANRNNSGGGFNNMSPDKLAQFKQVLGMGILTGQIDPGQVTAALPLLGITDNSKPLTGTDAKVVSTVKQGLNLVSDIQDAYNTGNAIQAELPDFLNPIRTGEAQQYKAMVTNLSDVIGRLRSGGQVGPEEESRFRSWLPKIGDSDETVKWKLEQFQNELTGVLSGMGLGVPTSDGGDSNLLGAYM